MSKDRRKGILLNEERTWGILFYWMLAFSLMPQASFALEAYVQVEGKSEAGQASLFMRAGRCYALTPNHVLDMGRYVTVITAGEASGPRTGQGDLCARLDGTDVALLAVSGLPVNGCGMVMSVVPSAESTAPADKTGIVQSVNQNGSIERRSVVVTFMGTLAKLEVTGIHESDRLTPGLSGSTLYLSGSAAGLLVSVETSGSGEGTVLRLDSIYSSLFRLFKAGTGAEIADPSCLQPGRTSLGTRPLQADVDFDVPLDGAQVVSWSAPPVSSLHRPETLLAPPEQGGYWAVQTSQKASVIIRLSDSPVPATRMVVSVHQMPRDARPAYLAAYSRGSERGPWTALPTPSDGFAHDLDQIELRFSPRRIEEIMVEIGAPESRRNVVGLSRISVFRTATR